MPLYDWECTKGHIFEQYISLTEYTKGMSINCSYCDQTAVRIYLTPRQARMAKAFEPSVFFEKDGELFVGGTNKLEDLKGYDKQLLKQGYKKIEITNFRQYEAFQRSHSKQLRVKHQQEVHLQKQLYNQAIQSSIDDIKQGYTWDKPMFNDAGQHIGFKKVQIPPLHRLEPQARAVAEIALEKLRDTSDMDTFKDRNARPYIEAFEQDNPRQEDERGSKKWF